MLAFPFSELREGQQKIIDAVRSSISKREKLMIQAPTGMGKTAPVLYGALSAAKEQGLRIVFLTAKHTHQNIVYETLRKINNASLEKITFTGVNGKRSMCLFENNVEPSLFIEFCRAVREQNLCDFYKNTFSKSKDVKPNAIEALGEELSDPDSMMEAGSKFEVCPYELSLLNAKRSDVIVANYFHIFDLDTSKSFISKTGLDPKNTIIIVDEAHNLHNRIIDMNSFSISLRTLERAYNEAIVANENDLAAKIDSVIASTRKTEQEEKLDLSRIFKGSDLDTAASITKQNEKGYNIPASFTLEKFISFLLKADDSYVQYASNENGHVKVNVFSLDPSVYAGSTMASFASTILISGTLKPMEMFSNLLGIPDANKLVIEEKNLEANRLVINEIDLTSKFLSRGLQFGLIAARIDDLLESFKHNMIIFFPSYSFMESVFGFVQNKDRVIKEAPRIEREEKQRIISEVTKPGKCLFAVIGGNFAESIGIRNNIIRLIAIVGVPYEPPSIRLKALQNYYQNKFSNGFEYAQVLPSMIKTMQAAGRGIRSSKDRAVVLLIDSRFESAVFRKYLPSGVKTVNGSPMKLIGESGFN